MKMHLMLSCILIPQKILPICSSLGMRKVMH